MFKTGYPWPNFDYNNISVLFSLQLYLHIKYSVIYMYIFVNIFSTRWHILVFHCMRKRAEESCNHSDEEKFRQIIWSISLDTRKFEKAAAYICHEHNLRSKLYYETYYTIHNVQYTQMNHKMITFLWISFKI